MWGALFHFFSGLVFHSIPKGQVNNRNCFIFLFLRKFDFNLLDLLDCQATDAHIMITQRVPWFPRCWMESILIKDSIWPLKPKWKPLGDSLRHFDTWTPPKKLPTGPHLTNHFAICAAVIPNGNLAKKRMAHFTVYEMHCCNLARNCFQTHPFYWNPYYLPICFPFLVKCFSPCDNSDLHLMDLRSGLLHETLEGHFCHKTSTFAMNEINMKGSLCKIETAWNSIVTLGDA